MQTPPLSFRSVCWLTAALALVTLPHAERVPWWITLLVCVLAGWRVYLGYVRVPLPSKWLLLTIVAAGTAGVYLHYRTIFGRDAGVALLVLMLTLKLLESRSQRDAMLLTFMGYFLVVTNFLYSQTIPTALYMFACVWFITALMIGLQHADHPGGYRRQLRTAGVLLAQAVPLMAVLFIFFPRVQGPLWGMPSDAYSRTSGLSDWMTPGSFSNLILSDAVAFRVRFTSKMPLPNQMYWRGPVLWDFDGRTWTGARLPHGTPQFDSEQPAVEYVVTMEAHNKRWLFALDLPGKVPSGAVATPDFQLLSLTPVANRLRYEMSSHLEYRNGAAENARNLERALELPAGYNPRTREFAEGLRRTHAGDDKAIVTAVLQRFRNLAYSYTLSPPMLGSHSVDEFLFQTMSGFCEHYSSAFVVLMRSAGIPARVVTGYQGGEVNPVGDYMIVRQADAHAWAEIWLKGVGWIRIDPTAAVSPARVERGIAAAMPASDPLPLLIRGDIPILRDMRLAWDSMANNWNQWVLGYNPDRQAEFLSRVGLDDATWRTLVIILMAATAVITLILSVFMLRKLRLRVRDPVDIAYQRFCRKLENKGLPRGAAEGPLDYARRVTSEHPEWTAAVLPITQLYVGLRYGPGAAPGDIQQLRRLAHEFQP
jgi:protein-glutamine gamma-glutamyltransferase